MLRPAHYRLHEIAVIEIDLEWRVGEVDRGEVESRLRQVDAVIVANFGAGHCCLHHAGVATCNVENFLEIRDATRIYNPRADSFQPSPWPDSHKDSNLTARL